MVEQQIFSRWKKIFSWDYFHGGTKKIHGGTTNIFKVGKIFSWDNKSNISIGQKIFSWWDKKYFQAGTKNIFKVGKNIFIVG